MFLSKIVSLPERALTDFHLLCTVFTDGVLPLLITKHNLSASNRRDKPNDLVCFIKERLPPAPGSRRIMGVCHLYPMGPNSSLPFPIFLHYHKILSTLFQHCLSPPITPFFHPLQKTINA